VGVAAWRPVEPPRPEAVCAPAGDARDHVAAGAEPARGGTLAADDVPERRERVPAGRPEESADDGRADAVVLDEAVGQRAVLPAPVGDAAAAVGADVAGDGHLGEPGHPAVECRQPVGAVAGTPRVEVLVETVERVECLPAEGDVAAVEKGHLAPAQGVGLDGVGRQPAAELLVDGTGHGVGVGQSPGDGVEPPLGDGQSLVDQCDAFAVSAFDPGVSGGGHRPVGHLDESVDVVALADHPGRPVGRGAVDDDHLGRGGVLGERVERPCEALPAVERRDDNRELHTTPYRSRPL